MLRADSQKFTVPPKVKFIYEDFNAIADTISYRVFEAKPRNTNEKHLIRILDNTKEFVKNNFDLAATLFIQELLRLQYLYPGSVLIHTLEISEKDRQIACAMRPYIPLSFQLDGTKEVIDSNDHRSIEKLLSDVLSDVEFLRKDLEIKTVIDLLGSENICFMKEHNGFFLSNWGKIFENNNSGAESQIFTHTITGESSLQQLNSKVLATEMKALAFAVLKIKKIDYTDLKALREMPNLKSSIYDYAIKETLADHFKDSKRLQNLIEKMLSLDPQILVILEELKIKEVEKQVSPSPKLEESKLAKTDAKNDPPTDSPLNKISSVIEPNNPKLLAFCSTENNNISIFDLGMKREYAKFTGVNLKNKDGEFSWTHLKEIPNTNLLVSLHHSSLKSANLKIFDISKKTHVRKVYAFEEVAGVTGQGDVTYNSRRNILGALPLTGKISYHLFNVDTNASSTNEMVKLTRKSKWYAQQNTSEENRISGFDFDPNGDSVAIIDRFGVCLVSTISTDSLNFHMVIGSERDLYGRCRWSSTVGEPLLFVKYNDNRLNLLDVEKKALLLKNPVRLSKGGDSFTVWIDVCQNNESLLAAAGQDKTIKIYDRRESKIVKVIEEIHSDTIACVRWSESGDMLASASSDKTAKLIELKTGKAIESVPTSDESNSIDRLSYMHLITRACQVSVSDLSKHRIDPYNSTK